MVCDHCPNCGHELEHREHNRTNVCLNCGQTYTDAELASDDPSPL